ncbi:MAG: replication-associated recombination protein A [Kiritimatiellia bacterium]
MDLFGKEREGKGSAKRPLAARLRPRTLDEIAGQESILGPGRLLRRAVEADRLTSVILYGPPGCGKTSIAEVIAGVTKRSFERTSGSAASVAALRDILKRAGTRRQRGGGETILFIDEMHRFSKSQQDVLLPHVEEGAVTLVGATTHNPLFFINSPLLSRSLVFELNPLSEKAVRSLLARALSDERGFASWKISADDAALDHLARVCDGDARRALNALEIAVLTTRPEKDGTVRLSREVAEESIQKKAVVYDHDEDGHYDTISAFIKSIRGSDPDAAIYWLAKMLYAGEDPRFIARRLVILASEDVGNADPRGLTLAVSAMHAVEFTGMPEARIILAHAVTYLAAAPKSNASYTAIEKAGSDVREGRSAMVPEHLKNIHVDAEGGAGAPKYVYPHDDEEGGLRQEYLPGKEAYYEPKPSGYEEVIAKRMKRLRQRKL